MEITKKRKQYEEDIERPRKELKRAESIEDELKRTIESHSKDPSEQVFLNMIC